MDLMKMSDTARYFYRTTVTPDRGWFAGIPCYFEHYYFRLKDDRMYDYVLFPVEWTKEVDTYTAINNGSIIWSTKWMSFEEALSEILDVQEEQQFIPM